MTPSEVLETKVEMALAEYLDETYPIPTQEWSDIAVLFVEAVEATQVRVEDADECIDNGFATADAAKRLVKKLGQLLTAMSRVVE